MQAVAEPRGENFLHNLSICSIIFSENLELLHNVFILLIKLVIHLFVYFYAATVDVYAATAYCNYCTAVVLSI